MQILAIDDEKIALEGLTDVIKKALPDAEIFPYRNALKAIEELENKHIDIAFLDIEMRDINGMQFADHLKERFPKINVIFTTGYSEYVGEAMDLHASGYIMKPVTLEKVKREIEDLRYPLEKTEEKKDVLRVQTFGNFEVLKNNQVLHFQYNKTKELFAYLVDRCGALTSNGEILGVLWEDDANPERKSSYLQNLRADMVSTLTEAGFPDVVVRQRGTIAIVPDKIECDMYEWKKDRKNAKVRYTGEYMNQFSWAEYSKGALE
ncbi:response regulator [Oribacterium sp. P6A1]|uniref:response regulator n=1 Tax=Oribacterium sp. P6A1 TaxID=1410612 RepID=UPI00055CB722|nr:response regulator [Oribacterium sp. P6A1]